MTRAGGAIRIESFRVEALKSLLADGPGPRLSIYLPTQRRHPDRKEFAARLHSLLHRAKELLETKSAVRDVEAFLEPLRQLDAESLAEHALDGLALFRSETSMAAYRLPMNVPEIVVVAASYHTKPLLRFLSSNRRYLVLAVSQNEVSLHEGTSYGAGPVDLHGVPKSLRDAIGVPDFSRTFESSYLRGAVFHGQGPGKELKKEELLRFFHTIDHGLHEYLRDEHVPLLLAAVDYYHPIYKQANRYAGLLDEGLVGNYDRANEDKIHADAWPIVGRVFEARVNTRKVRFAERLGTGLASDQIEEIGPAAVAGRVECLFVAEDDDGLDDVAEEAYKRGAEVYVVARASMPGPGPIAAIYRF